MKPIFAAQGVHREALAAIRLFVDAVRQERASVELAEIVLDFLRRSRYNEDVHFEGCAPFPEGDGTVVPRGGRAGNALSGTGPPPEGRSPPGPPAGRAVAFWGVGAGSDPGKRLNEARVLGLKASLRRDQRQLEGALDLLSQAIAVDSAGELKYLLLNRAKTFEEMGAYEDAIATLFLAALHINAEHEPRLLLIQRFNLNVNFCRLGRYADADRLLGEMEALAQKVAKGVAKVRIAWLHGWIAAGMGRLEEAEAALGAVREEFLVRNIGYDAALASLDLAKLYLQQGRTAEVKQLAGQLVAVFQEQGVHREALAAVQLFQKAADRERATLELVGRLADFLRRARHDAEVRFTG
jgi:tetratricopeptide (TPR) repeat protein